MNHASICTGIGGFDLAAQWVGWENIFQVEIDPFCQKVLQKNFPNTKKYGDIKQFNGMPYRWQIDILTGGIPCQPFSVAGRRAGAKDDRWLWPEMLRVIREVRPAWVIVENVAGIVNMELETICFDLESQGYEVQPYIIPACATQALHIRERVWVVAYSNSIRPQKFNLAPIPNQSQLYPRPFDPKPSYAYGEWELQQERRKCNVRRRNRDCAIPNLNDANATRQHFDSVAWQPNNMSEILREAYGVSGRVDGRNGRNARIKAMGNAIVPQVAYNIFSCINAIQLIENSDESNLFKGMKEFGRDIGNYPIVSTKNRKKEDHR